MVIAIGVTEMIPNAADIPAVAPAEAGRHAQTEYERLLALLESLEGDDWRQRTYCTAWNVRDMAGHLAGSMAGSSNFAEFLRQNMTHPYIREAANPVDGTNRLQVEERAGKTNAEVIDEFRELGPIAIRNRQKLPWLVRRIPIPPIGGDFGYLMDTIYPRDEWMHRYDICAATGRDFVVTPEHDGRIVALVLRDVARKLRRESAGRCIELHLTGALEMAYRFGDGPEPACTLEIDLFAFNLRSSERITTDEALSRARIEGDREAARWFLENATVLY